LFSPSLEGLLFPLSVSFHKSILSGLCLLLVPSLIRGVSRK
jgi:hypothetical protein